MVGVAPAANAPADFDPLDIRNALNGSEDADTAASVPEEMAKALANLTSTKTGAEAADRAPMTMRMPGQSELQKEEQPTRIVPPIAGTSERPPTDFASTIIQKDLAATIAGDVPAPTFLDDIPPSSLARAAQTSFDQRPLERKPLVTTVAMMGPISKIPLPSAARGGVAGNGTVAGVVRATRISTSPGVSPSNTPPRVLSKEQEDMPAPSEGATVMVSPDREAERGPETAPPVRPQMPPGPETKSVFAPDAPAAVALSEPAPSGPSAKFVGTLASAAPLVLPSTPSPISPPPESSGRDESTMMVLPEEIIEDEATVAGAAPPAQSPPKHGGTMMMVPPTKQAAPAPVPESAPDGTMMLAPMNRAPAPAPTPQPPVPPPVASPQPAPAAPFRVASNIKTSIGVAPPIFASPHGPMIPPTPIVSIQPAPPGKHQPSITPALPPSGSSAAMPSHNSLPVRPTVQLPTARSMPPPPPPKPLPQTPTMPPAVRASYAQLPPHQWPAEQKMPMPMQAAPQGSIGPQSDPHRPLTYSVFDPAEAGRVPVRSPSIPSRASLSDYKPKMSVGVKVGLVVLGVCLVAGTAGAIILGMSEDPPAPHPAPSASSVDTSASAFVPVPMPPPVDTTSAVPPPVAADPPPADPAPATSAAPTSTGKQPRRPKVPKEPIPPNPFGSSMPGKRK